MSKLIDRLRKVSEGEPHRMGFSNVQAAGPKIPAIAIVASLPRPDAGLAKLAVEAEADAVLMQATGLEAGSTALKQALKAAGDLPGGVCLDNTLPGDADKLAEAGVDFVVLHTETAPAAILRKEDLGRVVSIDPYLDDSLLRTIERLAVDAVIVELEQGNEEFLTIRELMACRRAVDMVRKPLILRVSDKLSAEDLGNLKDLGIESLLIEFSSTSSKDALSRIRAAIAKLPPRRKARESHEVVLPRPSQASRSSEPEDDEL